MEKKARGRPRGSIIRQNMVDLLYHLKKAYGYEIHRHYIKLFSPCTLRSIHHHLNFGLKTGEFDLVEQKKETGSFSWGDSVEKSYYTLGKEARPKKNENIAEYVSSLRR